MARRTQQQHRADPASLAEFARRAGVNRSSVTRLVASKLRSALLADGRIDAAHPSVAAWARGHGTKPSALLSRLARSDDAPTDIAEEPLRSPGAPTPRRKAPRAAAVHPPAPGPDSPVYEAMTPSTIEGYIDRPLREITAQFGNLRAFSDEVDVVNKVAATRRIDLANQETEGELISRELVKGHVFGWIDGLARKLLRDSAKTGARRVYGLARADAGIEEAEALLREILQSQIRAAKAQIVKALRGA